MLSVKNLSKQFGHVRALQDVSFEVLERSIAGIIGPNGAGKTTLLLSMAGLLPINGGTIHWNNEQTATSTQFRRIFFYVEDAVRPHALLPVEGVLSFYRCLFRRTQNYRDGLIDRLGLRTFLDARISELSKGAAKRFLIAVGLMSTQPVLMLDEPFDGLDLKQTLEFLPMLRETSAEGRTLVLSIHQLRDAERACDRFVLLNDGRLAGSGTLGELQTIAGCSQGSGLEQIFLALT
jgi:ABC-2 type transport system ATP-binding protein